MKPAITKLPASLPPICLPTVQACAFLGGISRKSLYRLTQKHGLRPIADKWSVERLREIVSKETEK